MLAELWLGPFSAETRVSSFNPQWWGPSQLPPYPLCRQEDRGWERSVKEPRAAWPVGAAPALGCGPELVRACAGGPPSPLGRRRERGGHSPATEVMGVFWLLMRNRNPANHILICSPQALQRGSAPEPPPWGVSSSRAGSFTHSLLHSFVQPVSSGLPGVPGDGPGAQASPGRMRPLLRSSRSDRELGSRSANLRCERRGRWKGCEASFQRWRRRPRTWWLAGAWTMWVCCCWKYNQVWGVPETLPPPRPPSPDLHWCTRRANLALEDSHRKLHKTTTKTHRSVAARSGFAAECGGRDFGLCCARCCLSAPRGVGGSSAW